MTDPTALSITPEQMAAALGVPLYRAPCFMPAYANGQYGRWKLTHGGFMLDHGYYSGLWGVSSLPILLRDRHGDGQTWDTWMSLSPHEIESQELAPRYAFGHTVVLGLGMGWVAANIALNPDVLTVTVIERDPEVITLFESTQAFIGLPAEAVAKLNVIEADALAWQPPHQVDFLYADIWLHLEEPTMVEEVRQMQANIKARSIYFWGQELAIAKAANCDPEKTDASEWSTAISCSIHQKIGLPLLHPRDFDYPELIAKIIGLRCQRFPKVATVDKNQGA